MDECLYFTNRIIGKGKVKAWVFRKECPKCKTLMGKPKDVRGIKRRAKFYVCSRCGYKESKEEHEASLIINIKYTCPFCGKVGETTAKYKRQSYKGIPSYIFECIYCKKKIPLTKKLKDI